jgi:hypothetical protein
LILSTFAGAPSDYQVIENGEIVPGASIFGAIVTDANVTVTVNGAVTQINIPNGGKTFYCYVAAQYSQATSQGLDLSAVIGNRTQTEVNEWWIPALIGLDAFVGLVCVCWFIANLRRYD